LYFLFDVNDDEVVEARQEASYLCDCVEIYLDYGNRGGKRVKIMDGRDDWFAKCDRRELMGYELHFLPTDPPRVYLDHTHRYAIDKPQTDEFRGRWAGQAVAAKTATGYLIELGFSVPEVVLQPGKVLGIETGVCDDDGRGRESIMMWTGTKGEFWVTMDEYGKAKLEPLPPMEPLFDHPVRDTSICLAADGCYYLTGTSGNNAGGPRDFNSWWYVNEGIRVWKSPDLKDWQPLGLVWSIEKDGTWQKEFKTHDSRGRRTPRRRALWAPEIHFLKGTFWLTFSMNYGGTGLLKSTTGKAEGPYVDVHPQGPLTDRIDASLFEDDDGSVYFVWQNGLVARMSDELTGLVEQPRLIKPANRKHVGFEGAFLFKADGRYYLSCAEFKDRGPQGQRSYDCMVASADDLSGPWSEAYLAIPHGGHNMFFQDRLGNWWATFFGNDRLAPFRERPAILRVDIDDEGRIQPVTDPPAARGDSRR
jgi:hypothetical protein